MNTKSLTDTAKSLVADGKGLLAMDESNPTCNKRFAKLGISQTVEARRAYREKGLSRHATAPADRRRGPSHRLVLRPEDRRGGSSTSSTCSR
jgi:hypothetical protein